jgi:hypothetical protein
MYAGHPGKELADQDDPYDLVRSSSGRSESAHLDRHTPSDKGDRHSERRSTGACDRSSSRGSLPSPAPTPGSVSSMGKSTPVGSVFSSEAAAAMDRESGNGIRAGSSYQGPILQNSLSAEKLFGHIVILKSSNFKTSTSPKRHQFFLTLWFLSVLRS